MGNQVANNLPSIIDELLQDLAQSWEGESLSYNDIMKFGNSFKRLSDSECRKFINDAKKIRKLMSDVALFDDFTSKEIKQVNDLIRYVKSTSKNEDKSLGEAFEAYRQGFRDAMYDKFHENLRLTESVLDCSWLNNDKNEFKFGEDFIDNDKKAKVKLLNRFLGKVKLTKDDWKNIENYGGVFIKNFKGRCEFKGIDLVTYHMSGVVVIPGKDEDKEIKVEAKVTESYHSY